MSAAEHPDQLESELPRLRRLARRLAPPGVDPEDLVQDVVERAWRSRESFRGEAGLSTWLHRILVNRVVDLGRRTAARPPSVAIEDRQDPPDWALELGDPELIAQRAEDSALLRLALSHLEPSDRTALVLFDAEEMTAAQIAEIVGSSAAAVHKRVQRARWRLARELAEAEAGGQPGARRRAAGAPPPPACRMALSHAGDYLEGLLDEREQARVDLHLRGCERCPPAVQALVGLRVALRGSGRDGGASER
jgi:RNA polymerase sigma factor (sigma-70 family)